MTAITAKAASPTIPGRWYTLAILTGLYTLNSIDRNVVSIVAEPIKNEHHLGDSQIGLLIGLAYAVSFAVAGIPLGLLVDRVNRTRFAAAILLVWSSLTFFSGLAQSFTQLLIARIGLAAAESGASPTCLSLITDLFPKNRRSTALGWFYFSTPMGLAAGFAVGGLVAAHYGWRAAFFVAGAPGFLLALLLLFTVKEPKRGAFEAAQTPSLANTSLVGLLAMFRERRTMLFLALAAMTLTTAQSAIGAFLAPLLIRTHHVPIAQAGLMVATAFGGGAAVGMLVGGWLGDKLSSISPTRSVLFVSCTIGLTGPIAMVALNAPSAGMTTALMIVYSVLLATYYGTTYSSYLSLAPASMRGGAAALLTVGNNLVGYGLGPPAAGFLSDAFARAGYAHPLQAAVTILAGLYLLAASLFFVASRTMKRDLVHLQ